MKTKVIRLAYPLKSKREKRDEFRFNVRKECVK
jgi:hypothetical protein